MPCRTLPSLFALTCLLSALCLSGCHQENRPAQSMQEDIASITAVSKARADAFKQGNAAGIAVHFTEEALLMAPGKPIQTGKAAVQSYYQHIFDEFETDLDSYYEEVQVSGDLAYGRGFAEVSLTRKQGGQRLKSTAKYMNILRRQADGSWKTTHDIWNSNE